MSAVPIKRVLLIQPNMTVVTSVHPVVYPPIGIMYLGAVLERAGLQVKILDCQTEALGRPKDPDLEFALGLSIEEISNIIDDFSPDLIGISCNFSVMFAPMLDIVAAAKLVAPGAVIVIGGHHATSLPEEVMEETLIDFVMMGESEVSFPALIEELNTTRRLVEVPGLVWRDEEGVLKKNPQAPLIKDLESLPYPAWHLFPYEKYSQGYDPKTVTWGEAEAMPSILTTRGCAADCVFCSVHNTMGRGFRARSLEDVFSEIRFLIERFGIKKLMVIDDNFTHSKKRAKEFCDEFKKQNFGIEIYFQVLALWCMDEELIDKLKSIGCTRMGFAIESGVQDTLNNIIKKPLNLVKSMELLRYAKSRGIHLTGTFVVGFPGETKKAINRSLYMANYSKLFDSREVYIATPLPGTELYRVCKENNYFVKDFSYSNVDVVKANISTEDFSADYIESIVEADRAHHLIKSSPRSIVRQIMDVRRRKPRLYLKVLFETARIFIKYDFLKLKEDYP
ncbi:MAG: cobalamin-dependent protein [Proteobacteria bacterium]|nr:cobalamin-dependent protein [Pseudomonadota bacterium]